MAALSIFVKGLPFLAACVAASASYPPIPAAYNIYRNTVETTRELGAREDSPALLIEGIAKPVRKGPDQCPSEAQFEVVSGKPASDAPSWNLGCPRVQAME